MSGTYSVNYCVVAVVMMICMIIIVILNVPFSLSYVIVTKVQLNAVLSPMCYFLWRDICPSKMLRVHSLCPSQSPRLL